MHIATTIHIAVTGHYVYKPIEAEESRNVYNCDRRVAEQLDSHSNFRMQLIATYNTFHEGSMHIDAPRK